MRNWKRAFVMGALGAGFGVTAALANASALQKFPGAKEQIMSYYGANAREPNCGAGNMTDIGDAKVVSASGDTAVVAVNYAFSATPGAGGTQCSGDSSRQFTLTKGGSGWTVSGMTGQAP
jgi:hypothetical protein